MNVKCLDFAHLYYLKLAPNPSQIHEGIQVLQALGCILVIVQMFDSCSFSGWIYVKLTGGKGVK